MICFPHQSNVTARGGRNDVPNPEICSTWYYIKWKENVFHHN
jgi:hypothetical protein